MVIYQRTGWSPQDKILTGSTVHVLTATTFARLCFVIVAVAKIEQRRQTFIDLKKHTSTIPPIAPGRATFGNEFLPSNSDRTITAVSRTNRYARFIDERYHGRPLGKYRRDGRRGLNSLDANQFPIA
jgi:hypothetical protein